MPMETVLVHHGVKGQKWGVRRYQMEDGTRTTLGRKHEAELEGYDYHPSTKPASKSSGLSTAKSSAKPSGSSSEKKGLTDEQKAKLKKAVIVVGATAAAAGLTYYGVKKYKDLKENGTIEAGQDAIRRMQMNATETFTRAEFAAGTVISGTKNKINRTVDNAKNTAVDAKNKVVNTVTDTKNKVTNKVNDTRRSIDNTVNNTKKQVRKSQKTLKKQVRKTQKTLKKKVKKATKTAKTVGTIGALYAMANPDKAISTAYATTHPEQVYKDRQERKYARKTRR